MLKKIVAVLLAMIMMAAMSSGCGGDADTDTETSQEQVSEQTGTDDVPDITVEDISEDVTDTEEAAADTDTEAVEEESETVPESESEDTTDYDRGDVSDEIAEEVPVDETEEPEPETTEPATAGFTLTCISFEDGEEIPSQHSYYGGNKSPELDWTGVPEETVSLTLLVEDPDGGDWSHWVVYNLGSDIIGLGEDQPYLADLLGGVYQGKNDFGQIGWGGPAPPSGTHRYYFRLYALDAMLDLAPGVTIDQVKAAMDGHIIEITELMGTYSAS